MTHPHVTIVLPSAECSFPRWKNGRDSCTSKCASKAATAPGWCSYFVAFRARRDLRLFKRPCASRIKARSSSAPISRRTAREGRGGTGQLVVGAAPRSSCNHSAVVPSAAAIFASCSNPGRLLTPVMSRWRLPFDRSCSRSSSRIAGRSPRASRGRQFQANHARSASDWNKATTESSHRSGLATSPRGCLL